MSTTTWIAKDKGIVKAAATGANPDLVVLSAPGLLLEQFDCSVDLPVGPVTFSVKTRSYFALYVEVDTNRGPRQFKFVPTDRYQTKQLFRYRYQVGVGKSIRNGKLQTRIMDLQSLASYAEPGISIRSVEGTFVRIVGEMHVEVIDGASVPTPFVKPAPTPRPAPTSGSTLTTKPMVGTATTIAAACVTASCTTDPGSTLTPGEQTATSATSDDDTIVIEDTAAPPVVPTVDGDISTVEAVRFLTQATFGPSPTSIQELQVTKSYSDWVDAQQQTEASTTLQWVKANSNGSNSSYRHKIWTTNVLTGPDQLRQRVAFALSELFVISDLDYELSNSQYAVSQFYDILTESAFGNYRELLERVTLHSSMGVYLSHIRNEKADVDRNIRPDENYAREILQLFSIGLFKLGPNGQPLVENGEPVATYGQLEVENFAKVFTGWSYAGTGWGDNNAGRFDKEAPMAAFEEYHDTSEKVLLNGTVLPSGQTAQQDLTGALDNIFAHDNVAPFISMHLIGRLVTSNPTPGYVSRIAAVFVDNGNGQRGDLGAVVKAILLDSEARTGHLTMPETFGKFKEPLLRFLQLLRTFNVQPGATSEGHFRPKARPMEAIDNVVGQAVMQARHVFNFFLPSTRLRDGGKMVAPELEILTEINVASTNNMLFAQIYNGNHTETDADPFARIQLQREVELASDVDALMSHLNTIMTGGAMPAEAIAIIADHVRQIPLDDSEGALNRALDATFMIAASPFHLVQK